MKWSKEERNFVLTARAGGLSRSELFEAHDRERRRQGWPPRSIQALTDKRRFSGRLTTAQVAESPVRNPRDVHASAGGSEHPDAGMGQGGVLETPDTPTSILERAGLEPGAFELTGVSIRGEEGWTKARPLVPSVDGLRDAKDAILEEIRGQAPRMIVQPRLNLQRMREAEGKMAAFAPMDLHLGKLAWAPETGENFDLQIAERRYTGATGYCLDRIGPAEELNIVVGQDFFHIDQLLEGKIPATTRGTAQDVDGRWQKAFRIGVRLMRWTVQQALHRFPKVTLVVSPGNHDRAKTWFLGEVLAAAYEEQEKVQVENGMKSRQTIEWGGVGLMITHGDSASAWKKMDAIFASEYPEMWGRTWYREILAGHLHSLSMDERPGVRLIRLPSLSGTDLWHYDEGWVGSVAAATARVYHADRGLINVVHHCLTPEERQPAA